MATAWRELMSELKGREQGEESAKPFGRVARPVRIAAAFRVHVLEQWIGQKEGAVGLYQMEGVQFNQRHQGRVHRVRIVQRPDGHKREWRLASGVLLWRQVHDARELRTRALVDPIELCVVDLVVAIPRYPHAAVQRLPESISRAMEYGLVEDTGRRQQTASRAVAASTTASLDGRAAGCCSHHETGAFESDATAS